MKVEMPKVAIAALIACLALTACATTSAPPATGTFQSVGPDLSAIAAPKQTPVDYKLGAFDKISIRVFQFDDLTVPEVQVDANGQVMMPQVGALNVSGMTTNQVADAIRVKLVDVGIRNPQVLVSLREALSQQVTVTGAVKQSGVLNLRGRVTLQQVVAMAGGPVMETADLKHVAVIRYTNGVRTLGVFNLQDINTGKFADPEILAGDVVVVDTSSSKSAFRTAVQAIPFVGVFTLF